MKNNFTPFYMKKIFGVFILKEHDEFFEKDDARLFTFGKCKYDAWFLEKK